MFPEGFVSDSRDFTPHLISGDRNSNRHRLNLGYKLDILARLFLK